MSAKNHFRISIDFLLIHSSLCLIGIILASIFVFFSSDELKGEFFEKFRTYYEFSEIGNVIVLFLQEYLWILLIVFIYRLPYGRLVNFLILIYKGFGIGVVSSIACGQLGAEGLKYILLLVFPPNFFYIISQCIASQIANEIKSLTRGQHNKGNGVGNRIYIICLLLTSLGALIESFYVPWMYNIIF